MPSPTPMDESTLELIHLVVDGTASPAQAQELERILDSSAEARDMLESLRSTVRELGRIPEVEVPPTLKARILREARDRATPSPRAVSLRPRRWVLGAAWGVAAAGLLAYVAFVHGPGASKGAEAPLVSGTMADLDRRTWPLLSQQAAQDLEGAPASLTLRRKGDQILLLAELGVGRPKPMSVKWDPGRFVLLKPPVGGGHISLAASSGELVIPANVQGPVSLLLGPREASSGPGAITLEEDGREIIQTSAQFR